MTVTAVRKDPETLTMTIAAEFAKSYGQLVDIPIYDGTNGLNGAKLIDALRRAALGRIGAWLEDRLRPTVLSACFDCAFRGDPVRAPEAYRDLTALRQFANLAGMPLP